MAITERYATSTGAGLHDGTSEANAWSYTEAVANRAAGQRVNWKDSGSRYSWTPSADTVAGTSTSVSIIRGYTTTIGDGGKCRLSLSGQWSISGDGTTIQDLDIEGSVAGYLVNMSSDSGLIHRCKVVNTSTTGDAVAIYSEDTAVFNCYVKSVSSSSTSFALRLRGGHSIANTVVSNTTGIYLFTSSRDGQAVRNNVIGVSATGNGIEQGSTSGVDAVYNNSIVGFAGDGIKFISLGSVPGSGRQPVFNNIIYDCGNGITNAQEGTNDTTVWLSHNAIGAVTTAYEFGDNPIHNAITLTADPFTDSANEDMTLNNTAGGGALCRGAGLGPAGA